jgi:cytochrome c556
MRTTLLAALALALAACVANKTTPLADIPKLTSLEDVMDNQATAIDPQFKKIGQATFTDAELAAIGQAAERVQATSLKTKDFAKDRAEFAAIAGKLNDKAKALGTAAGAKDAKAVSGTLEEMKALCKECHSKFR